MNRKSLEKATKLLKRVKELEKEIDNINKIATSVLENKSITTLNLKIEHEAPSEEDNFLAIQDAATIHKTLRSMVPVPMFIKIKDLPSAPKKETHITEFLNDTLALKIIGVLIGEKRNELEKTLLKIKQLGFAID